MSTQRTDSPDASSADAADLSTTFAGPSPPFSAHPEERLSPDEAASRRTKRNGRFDGHLPDIVEPLTPRHPETALTETRRLRHDGWAPEKMRPFLERFAECGVIVEACEAAGMSARSAYNLRDRDPLFAAGWEAAQVMARPKLADEAWSRALNGMVERIYKDGMIVAERHRYDNKLTMAVLARLDQRIDRAEEQGAPHLALLDRWDDCLAALAEDRREDGLALLAPPAPETEEEVHEIPPDRELHELHPPATPPAERDFHRVWEDEDEPGRWWTDYPPPLDFVGEEEGAYGDDDYRRALSPREQAVIDADCAAEDAEQLARAQAQRAAYFEEVERPATGGLGAGEAAG